jgi:FAD:protein FMN transferase
MKKLRLIMGMPITIEITDKLVTPSDIDAIFHYFSQIDEKFSTYKKNSEISQLNSGKITYAQLSHDVKHIFEIAEETKIRTHGYFNICQPNGFIDPSGIVKGWAIYNASKKIDNMGFSNYYVDAGGDIQVKGVNSKNIPWRIGIRNPFNRHQHIKIISIGNKGVATSGTSIRGQHIYDPYTPKSPIDDIVSITVIGPNVYEADRFATAAFAMKKKGIEFIASLQGYEAYSINNKGIATFTPGFKTYVVKNN